MDGLSLGIFMVPTIVLTLVVLFYMNFSKVVSDRQNFNHLIFVISIVAFFLNLVWELVQGPLYEGFEYDWGHILFCGLASLADMLMVLILFLGIGLIFKNIYWIRQMGIIKVLLLISIGLLGSIMAEVWHTMRGDWSYADTMPLVPYVGVGISPVLQFMVLPWLCFGISKGFIRKKSK